MANPSVSVDRAGAAASESEFVSAKGACAMEQILRLDMGTLTHRFEPLPEVYALLGGRALTSRILCDELDPTVDALGPNNKLVLAPGLLSGSVVSSSSRISAGAKSPLTGGIKESNSGGNTGWRLAQHGLQIGRAAWRERG